MTPSARMVRRSRGGLFCFTSSTDQPVPPKLWISPVSPASLTKTFPCVLYEQGKVFVSDAGLTGLIQSFGGTGWSVLEVKQKRPPRERRTIRALGVIVGQHRKVRKSSVS